MKWTIRVELTPDGNEPITCDIGTITRPIVDIREYPGTPRTSHATFLLFAARVEVPDSRIR